MNAVDKNQFIDAEGMEQAMEHLHAEVIRLSNELNNAKIEVRTECDALRQLVAQAMTQPHHRQQQRRLNHREAERYIPQAFGGSRQDYADFVPARELRVSPLH